MTTARIQNQHSPGRQQSLNTSLCTSETQECIDVDSVTSVVLFAACRFLRASTEMPRPAISISMLSAFGASTWQQPSHILSYVRATESMREL